MQISEELKNALALINSIHALDTPTFELKAYIDVVPCNEAIWRYVVTPVGLAQEAHLVIDPGNRLYVELYNENSNLGDKLTIQGNADLHGAAELIIAYLKAPKMFDRYKNADRS